ncbi:hypothetical protein [Bartonella bacilliformis]|uniref:hypothetical protein n=1 Tax=Bartonella bacilliformis TaxID=774 RepID=UPI0039E39095
MAALVAANFLNPWADFFMPAWLQGFTKHVDKAFFDEFFSLLLQINVSSPIGPVASVAANLGKMGRKTSV